MRSLEDIYLVLGSDPEENSCFSIYQNNGIKMHFIFKENNTMETFFSILKMSGPHGINYQWCNQFIIFIYRYKSYTHKQKHIFCLWTNTRGKNTKHKTKHRMGEIWISKYKLYSELSSTGDKVKSYMSVWILGKKREYKVVLKRNTTYWF